MGSNHCGPLPKSDPASYFSTDDFPGPEVFQKDSPGEDFYPGRNRAGLRITGHQYATARSVFLPEGGQPLEMLGLGGTRPFNLDDDFMVPQDEIDFQLGGCSPVRDRIMQSRVTGISL